MAIIGLTRELYFITTTVIDWLDVFTRPAYKHVVVESLRYCQTQKGLEVYAWVLMTNYLHLIAGTSKPDTNIWGTALQMPIFEASGLQIQTNGNPGERFFLSKVSLFATTR
jgi:hypothetical protein